MSEVLLVSLFGVVGVISRYLLGLAVIRLHWTQFPIMTMSINILGSLLIGVIYVVGVERGILSAEMRIALMTGLLGGFTTFSAFSLETVNLIEKGEVFFAIAYVAISVVVGICATATGLWATRMLFARV